jgi:hypothetical protein
MTHAEAVYQFHRAGAFGVVGNALAYWTARLVLHMKRRAELRATVRAIARSDRVAATKICEGCHQRGRHGHSWFCPNGDIPFFNYHDMNTHVGIRRSS